MKRKTVYSKAPKEISEAIRSAEAVEDFLPSPDKLVAREEAVKVTLSLGKHSVEFFKKMARENQVPYQTMIRRVVDLYAQHHMPKGE